MKAIEKIWIGDILVEEDDGYRPATNEDAGKYYGPGPFDYAWDKVKIAGIAGANADIDEEVVLMPMDDNMVMEVQ